MRLSFFYTTASSAVILLKTEVQLLFRIPPSIFITKIDSLGSSCRAIAIIHYVKTAKQLFRAFSPRTGVKCERMIIPYRLVFKHFH